MSNLEVDTINDANGGSAAVLYGVASPPNSMGFRNRIINGDMRIDQRNNGAAVTPTDGGFTLDRWKTSVTQASKLSMQRVVTAPAGFVNSILVTSLAATSLGANDTFGFYQPIEGYNIADFGFGTAGASTITISFWVRSSITGTYSVSVTNGAVNRSCPVAYTINAANTWEQKTVTLAGDTAGAWSIDNNAGLNLFWNLGVSGSYGGATSGAWVSATKTAATGQTNWISTNGATFYITGVQLEAGSVASPFERRDYGRELMMCQRYFQKTFGLAGDYVNYGVGVIGGTSTAFRVCIPIIVPMRSGPTLDLLSTSIFDGVNALPVSAIGTFRSTPNAYNVDLTGTGSGLVVGRSGQLLINPGVANYVAFTAEL